MPDNETGEASGLVSRRQVLYLGGAFAAGAALLPPYAHADPTIPAPITDDASLEQALPALSNWGRWGADDQLGTLNFITAEKRLAAAALIRTGRVVPLGREFSPQTPRLRDFHYEMRSFKDDALPEEAASIDIIGMTCHGFALTHIDALCHYFTPPGPYWTPTGTQAMYNGYPVDDVTPNGALKLGIEHVGATGMVGRGVLLDIAELHGGPLPLGTIITVADLEAAERAHGVKVGEGDIVFIRNGAGPANTFQNGSGLHAECLPWLRDRRVAVLSSDSDSDVHPTVPGFNKWTLPMHMVGIPYMGLQILDNTELDGVAQACAQEGRWEFFLSVAPWRMRGATGSVVNPLAMF
jgi:kynurenine formamidase